VRGSQRGEYGKKVRGMSLATSPSAILMKVSLTGLQGEVDHEGRVLVVIDVRAARGPLLQDQPVAIDLVVRPDTVPHLLGDLALLEADGSELRDSRTLLLIHIEPECLGGVALAVRRESR